MGACFTTEYDELKDTYKKKRKLVPLSFKEKTSKKDKRTCINETEVRAEVDYIFDKYDPDHDGFLEKHEIRRMIKELSESRKKPFSREDIIMHADNFMSKADTSGDGKIDKEEFYLYYKTR